MSGHRRVNLPAGSNQAGARLGLIGIHQAKRPSRFSLECRPCFFIFASLLVLLSPLPVYRATKDQAISLIQKGQAISPRSGNPILPGWYADPEARVFQNEYWIYPTYSAPYDQQVFMVAFSSKDLITWTKHPRVLDIANVHWARRALWAPSIVEKGGWYYLF